MDASTKPSTTTAGSFPFNGGSSSEGLHLHRQSSHAAKDDNHKGLGVIDATTAAMTFRDDDDDDNDAAAVEDRDGLGKTTTKDHQNTALGITAPSSSSSSKNNQQPSSFGGHDDAGSVLGSSFGSRKHHGTYGENHGNNNNNNNNTQNSDSTKNLKEDSVLDNDNGNAVDHSSSSSSSPPKPPPSKKSKTDHDDLGTRNSTGSTSSNNDTWEQKTYHETEHHQQHQQPVTYYYTQKVVTSDDITSFDNPSKVCLGRIYTDLKNLYKDPLDGIFVVQDEIQVNRCHAIVVGPLETPYEHGMFYFIMDFPNNYPLQPPNVQLKTTGGGKIRFNPNLYKDGKVCLSILGTWSGPSWSPVQNIGSILISIQSLMTAHPYHNEPGYETLNRGRQEPKNYNHIVRHETVRIAVVDMVDWVLQLSSEKKVKEEEEEENGQRNDVTTTLPDKLRTVVLDTFLIVKECCQQICFDYNFLDGRQFQDPYHSNQGIFEFETMQQRLVELEEQVLSNKEEKKEGKQKENT